MRDVSGQQRAATLVIGTAPVLVRTPTAVRSLPFQQPVTRVINDLLVDFDHIRRVHQKPQRVCGDSYVRLATPPVTETAFLFAIVKQAAVTVVQKALRASARVEILTRLFLITQQQQARIRSRN